MQVTLKDGQTVQLGRKPIKALHTHETFVVRVGHDGKVRSVPRLVAFYYANKDTAPPPAKVDWAAKAMAAISRMYKNDALGDCVIAGKYHQVGIWSANDTGTAVVGTDTEVVDAYRRICGPGDNGCDIVEVLDAFMRDGLAFSGKNHKIDGYASVDWMNRNLVMVAIDLFGSLTLGINLPNDWTCTNCTWDVTRSGIVGGHDVCVCGYDDKGVQICTWAGIVTITWPAFTSAKWIEECYVQLAPDWYNADNLAPNGINVQALRDALAAINGGGTPPIPDPGPPAPPIPPGPLPPPVPVPPLPTTFNVAIPQQSVIGPWGITFGHVNAFNVQGTIGTRGEQPTIHLPPWLLPLIRQACAGAVILPPPWGMIVGIVCGLIPAQGTRADLDGITITIPPWLMALLQAACASAANLPPPYNFFALAACSLLPTTARPCGCK
jgi:hypothetical protein